MTLTRFAAGALVLALAAPAFGQGNGNGSGKGQGKSQTGNGAPGKGQSAPPSRNELAPVAPVAAPPVVGATPIAWVDDATLLDPGAVALSVSAVRWSGSDLSEVDVPIVNAALGLAPRVQLAASVPRTLGSADPTGASGGVGTSFFSAKVQLLDDRARHVKVAVAPTMQVLGAGVVAALGPDEGRVRWGLPVSAEISSGALRLYGGGGYFAPGLWFTGAAVGVQTTPKLTINAGISRAWRGADGLAIPLSDRDRKEITGGAAYALSPHVAAFGSVGRTVATLDENGAGTTVSGGLSVWFATAPR